MTSPDLCVIIHHPLCVKILLLRSAIPAEALLPDGSCRCGHPIVLVPARDGVPAYASPVGQMTVERELLTECVHRIAPTRGEAKSC